MANEINTTGALSASKNGVTVATGTISKTLTMSGAHMIQRSAEIGYSSDEQLDFGDISGAPAVLLFRNLDSTNYVELSYGTGANFDSQRFATIVAGFFNIITPISGTIYAKADTAACVVSYAAVEA